MKEALLGKEKVQLNEERILEPSSMEAGETEISIKTFPSNIETSRAIVPEPGIFIV